MTLTAKKVAQLKEPGRYGDGSGLYLQGDAGRRFVLDEFGQLVDE